MDAAKADEKDLYESFKSMEEKNGLRHYYGVGKTIGKYRRFVGFIAGRRIGRSGRRRGR